MPIATECAKCLRPLQKEEAIRLWDAEDCCRPCVERASPSLAEFAKRHAKLNDRFALARHTARFWLRLGLFAAIALLAPLATAILFRLWEGDDPVGWGLLGLVGLLGAGRRVGARPVRGTGVLPWMGDGCSGPFHPLSAAAGRRWHRAS
jgi:hypothetical protein